MKERYAHGLKMSLFLHLSEISFGNKDYYRGFKNEDGSYDLLFAETYRDEGITQWCIVNTDNRCIENIGYSYISKYDELILY